MNEIDIFQKAKWEGRYRFNAPRSPTSYLINDTLTVKYVAIATFTIRLFDPKFVVYKISLRTRLLKGRFGTGSPHRWTVTKTGLNKGLDVG